MRRGWNEGAKLADSDVKTTGSLTEPRYITYVDSDGRPGKAVSEYDIPANARRAVVEGFYYPYHEAIDFYHRYKEDIAMCCGDGGFKVFRMSIAWMQIFSQRVEEEPNQARVGFFTRMYSWN